MELIPWLLIGDPLARVASRPLTAIDLLCLILVGGALAGFTVAMLLDLWWMRRR